MAPQGAIPFRLQAKKRADLLIPRRRETGIYKTLVFWQR
jgi:hypothetical protein